MTLRTKNLRCGPVTPQPPKVAEARAEAEFTAEGSPPPGKVGAGHPTLPAAESPLPATTGADATTSGKR